MIWILLNLYIIYVKKNFNIVNRISMADYHTISGISVSNPAYPSVNYNNNSNRNSRVQEQAPSTPGSVGRRRYSSENPVPKIIPYDDEDVRKDYNKRESRIDRSCNKRLDYRHYRMDRRDSDSSRDWGDRFRSRTTVLLCALFDPIEKNLTGDNFTSSLWSCDENSSQIKNPDR